VLAFIARRVGSEPIVVLFALRDGFATQLDLVGLREMCLEGLADEAAGELIDALPEELPAELKRRVMRMAAGNPLALVELPRVLKAEATARGPGCCIRPSDDAVGTGIR
jgi:hypothetical protein